MKEISYIADLNSYGAGMIDYEFDFCANEIAPLRKWIDKRGLSYGTPPPYLSMELIDILGNDDVDPWCVYVFDRIDHSRMCFKRGELDEEIRSEVCIDEQTARKCFKDYGTLGSIVYGEHPEWSLAAFKMVGPARLRLYYVLNDPAFHTATIEADIVSPNGVCFAFREFGKNGKPAKRKYYLVFGYIGSEYCVQAFETCGKVIRKYEFGYAQEGDVFEKDYDRMAHPFQCKDHRLGKTRITEITVD